MKYVALLVFAVALTGGYLIYDRDRRSVETGDVDGGVVDTADDAGAPGESVDSPRAPLAGSELEITLHHAPLGEYLGLRADDSADEAYRSIVEQLGRARYDRNLSRAAREFAFQYSVLGENPPEAVSAFIKNASGAPDVSTSMLLLSTDSYKEKPIGYAIKSAFESSPLAGDDVVVGVGEAVATDEKLERIIIVLVGRRPFELEPTPTFAAPGTTWRVRGRLPAGYREPSATVLYPDDELETYEVTTDGRRFELDVPVRDTLGVLQVSIDGTGNSGPGKLLQLSVTVGDAPLRSVSVLVPDADPEFETADDAERYAFELLNRDRVQHGRSELVYDDELSKIGRSHSREMVERNYFGHLSPTTGLAGERVRAAGYRASMIAENLAKNDSVGEAQSSLMYSVGHRSNLLSRVPTHVGLGVWRETGRDKHWLVTQVFARKVVEVDPAVAAQSYIDRINAARSGAGREPLEVRDDLSEVALDGATRAAGGDSEGVAKSVGEAALPLVTKRIIVSVQVIYTDAQFSIPDDATAAKYKTIGIGVAQSGDDFAGRTGVVLILAE